MGTLMDYENKPSGILYRTVFHIADAGFWQGVNFNYFRIQELINKPEEVVVIPINHSNKVQTKLKLMSRIRRN